MSGNSLAARVTGLAPRLAASAAELVERGAYGVAARILVPGLEAPLLISTGHVDTARSAALRGDELFPIASQSKLLTAALVLLLERRGQISFDDPVSRYLSDAPAVDPGATIDQLLNHTSGIGNFIHSQTALVDPLPTLSFDDLLALARLQGRQSAPGTRFDYNNTDVLLLARICEQVTGRSREALLQEGIFAPLGMTDTMVGFGDASRRSRFAKGYYEPSACRGEQVDVSAAPDLSIAGAAGDITSSLPDLAILFAALGNTSNPTGLTIRDFVQNVTDTGAEPRPLFSPRTYGRGAEAWLWGGRPCWGHRGSIHGYHSGTFLEPGSGVVMTMFMTILTMPSPHRFVDPHMEGYMRFMAEAMTMMVDAIEMLPCPDPN